MCVNHCIVSAHIQDLVGNRTSTICLVYKSTPWLVQSKSLHGLIRLGSILKYLFFQVLILGDSLFCIGVHIHYIVIPMCYFYNSWNWQRIRCRVSPCIAIETHLSTGRSKNLPLLALNINTITTNISIWRIYDL